MGRGRGATLRGFVDWACRQADEDAMALESVVPEADDDAVRILTIHAAKGLEFPIIVVAGLSVARMVADQARVLWGATGQPELKCGRVELGCRTVGWERLEALDEAMAEHEQARLLYVACTRARDHLVVCTHHGDQRGEATAAARLASWCVDVPVDARTVPELRALGPAVPPLEVPTAPPERPGAGEVAVDLAVAETRRRTAIERATRPAAVAATAVVDLPDPLAVAAPELGAAHGPAPEPEGGEATDAEGGPPARRPGAGTAIGSAVHAVLEHAPLDPAWAGIEAAARGAAAEHGCPDLVEVVIAAVRAGLGSTAAATAAAAGESRRWREVFVATEVGGTVVEGFVDLLVRTDEGLVVVDWKSDAIAGERALDEKADRYGLQLATYALALEQVTGVAVVRTVLVFCGGGGPAREVERSGPALLRDKAAVRRRLG